MSARLLISWLPGETRAVLQCGGRMTRLVVQRRDHPRYAGSIYLGRVTGVGHEMAAAFVDIGAERDALLPLARLTARPSPGDSLLVEVVREPVAGKGARLGLCPPGLAAELASRLGGAKPPVLLRRGAEPLAALLKPAPGEIWVDQVQALSALRKRYPGEFERARLAPDGAGLFEREGLESEIDSLLQPLVALPSGGSLLIEPVSSMVPIDVNSAATVGAGGPVGTALQVNREAADEIPRQLQLRALAGLVVIDFLELREASQRAETIERLRRGLKRDRVPSRVQPMRASGLVELTRHRVGPALHEILTRPCGLGGAGRRKAPATLAYEALRALLRAAAAEPGKPLALVAEAAVISQLEGPLSDARAHAESLVGRPWRLRRADSRDAPDYEVVINLPA